MAASLVITESSERPTMTAWLCDGSRNHTGDYRQTAAKKPKFSAVIFARKRTMRAYAAIAQQQLVSETADNAVKQGDDEQGNIQDAPFSFSRMALDHLRPPKSCVSALGST